MTACPSLLNKIIYYLTHQSAIHIFFSHIFPNSIKTIQEHNSADQKKLSQDLNYVELHQPTKFSCPLTQNIQSSKFSGHYPIGW